MSFPDYQVLKSGRTPRGWVKAEVNLAGNVADEWRFYDVRGAFVWEPVPYFLILGEEAIDELDAVENRRGVLRLLEEYESTALSIGDFLSRLTDSLSLHSATEVYADTRKKEYSDLFYDYLHKRNLRQFSMVEAPFCADFRLGQSIVQDWVNGGLLSIPKTSLVWGQLESLSPGDIANEPEKRFPRLRALAFGVCGFQKYCNRPILDITKILRPYFGQHRDGNWMV